ncbi:MAG: DinB family protein, partial [Phycisphaerales bacterium]
LSALLGGLDDLAVLGYGEGTFSPYHVVGHLIIGERTDWIPRARIVLEAGPDRVFEPFDHRATIEPGSSGLGEGPGLGDLLDEFAGLRADNLDVLRSFELDASTLALEGTHPALGRVTLANLIGAWATHDLHHIAQVCKGLAYQHREDVGPWRPYLGVIPG